jgi:hypothetical protein
MPITLIDIIKQQNRDATSGDFFFMVDSGDVNFKVQGIQVDATLDPGTTTDYKYILTDVGNLNAGFGSISGVGNNDIVRYTGSAYEIFLDASNKQQGTIVFNEGDSKFYGFDGSSWQELGSGVAGPTGATGATGEKGETGEAGGIPADYVESLNGQTGTVVLGSDTELIYNSAGDLTGSPSLVYTGLTFGVTGDVKVVGNLIVTGVIITSTGIQGDSTNGQQEPIDGMLMDGGEY